MQVDQRTEWLDQVVGKVEGILLAVVEQADGGVQAVRHQPARDGATQHGITVVQRCIGPARAGAGEVRTIQLREIEGGGLRFEIVRVTPERTRRA